MTTTAELTWQVQDLDEPHLDGWTDPFERTPVWSRPDLRRFAADLPQQPLLNLVASRDGQPILAAPLLVSSEPGGLLFYDVPAMVGDERAFGAAPLPAVPTAARAAAYPSLAVGIHGGHHGILVDPALDRDDRVASCRALPAAVAELAETLGCRSHALLYLTPALVTALAPAAEPVVLGAQSMLRFAGTTFDDYLGSLTSRRRRHVRSERSGYLAGPNRTVVREGPDALGPDLVELRCALRARYGHPVERARTESEFASLARHCGERLVVFRAVQNGDTVGFSVFLRDGETLYGRTAGFDYDRLRERDYCYFNLGYYEPVTWCLERGLRAVEMGLSSYATKRTRGCVFEPRFGFFTVPTDLRAALAEQDRTERVRLAADCGSVLAPEGHPSWM
jgi:hypothetical protein